MASAGNSFKLMLKYNTNLRIKTYNQKVFSDKKFIFIFFSLYLIFPRAAPLEGSEELKNLQVTI